MDGFFTSPDNLNDIALDIESYNGLDSHVFSILDEQECCLHSQPQVSYSGVEHPQYLHS